MLILRPHSSKSPELCNYLSKMHGFTDLTLLSKISKFQSKWNLFVQLIFLSFCMLKNINVIRRADTIFAIGHISIPLKLFSKLHVIRYRTLYSYGFFIHSPRWFPLFRWLAKLDTDKNFYIVNSEREVALYSKKLNINQSKLVYLPYGDWDSRKISPDISNFNPNAKEPYYFAGGYSNRDYVALVKAFRKIPHRLVIVCSWLNSEINGINLPDNVKVFKDIPSHEFEEYIRRAKCCILPLKYDTGASGQLVLLRYMRNRRIIIASSTDVIREYLVNGASGIFVQNIEDELPHIIEELEERPGDFEEFGEAAYERYKSKFAFEVISKRLSKIIYGHLEK